MLEPNNRSNKGEIDQYARAGGESFDQAPIPSANFHRYADTCSRAFGDVRIKVSVRALSPANQTAAAVR